jgi:hypothetical protein
MSQPTPSDIQPIDNFVIIHEMLWTIRTNVIDVIENHLKRLTSQYFGNLSGDFTDAIIVIKRSIAKTFQQLQSNIVDKLEEHGLTGVELRRKQNILNRASDYLREHIGKPLTKAREAVNLFLDAADVILDSLVMVVPGPGAAKEVKATLKIVIGALSYHRRSNSSKGVHYYHHGSNSNKGESGR